MIVMQVLLKIKDGKTDHVPICLAGNYKIYNLRTSDLYI